MLTGFAGIPVNSDMVAGETTYRHEYSDTVHIMVDKMCYLADFGWKSVFETKIPASSPAQFNNYMVEIHSDQADFARQKFAEDWKAYVLADSPDKDTPHACSIGRDIMMLGIFGQ